MECSTLVNLFLLFSSFVVPPCFASCNFSDYQTVVMALRPLAGFDPSTSLDCKSPVREINLSSKGFSGSISWMYLASLTQLQSLDLSNNSILGSIPGAFWFTSRLLHLNLADNQLGGSIGFVPSDPSRPFPVLQTLDISNNRFTSCVSLSPFKNLSVLDVSGNRITNNSVISDAFELGSLSRLSVARNSIEFMPNRLNNSSRILHLDLSGCGLSGNIKPISFLSSLTYLDVSFNRLSGAFPQDFPPVRNLSFLNVSSNRFTCVLDSDMKNRFGNSAFTECGLKHYVEPARDAVLSKHESAWKRIVSVASCAGLLLVLGIVFGCLCLRKRKEKSRTPKWIVAKPPPTILELNESGPFSFETESGIWVADIKEPSSAAVVMFDKPLVRFTFADLIVATAHFSKESQLAESWSGPVYRAVLSADIHVAIKVLKRAKDTGADEAVSRFEILGRLKHPNLLPLLGYCIAGKEKLLLYEFMANGNLHQWLHGLPTGHTDVEDWSMDTWEQQTGGDRISVEKMGWITRHRITVGIARGLAYLHHGGAKPIVHGRLNPYNVFLDDDFQARISDFGVAEIIHSESHRQSSYSMPGSNPLCPESDVYSFGVVLLELMTGRIGSPDMVAWVRTLVRDSHGVQAIDPRLKWVGSISCMVESLWVGYLCTAESSKKRPTMQQVVGLLKDISP